MQLYLERFHSQLTSFLSPDLWHYALNCIICQPFVTFVDTRLYIVSTTVDSLLTTPIQDGFLCKNGLLELVPAFLHSLYLTIRRTNLVPRALFPGFEGGTPPSKPGKSALRTRLKTDITVRRTLGAGPLSVHAYSGEYVLAIVIRKNARNKFTLYLPCAILRPKGILHRQQLIHCVPRMCLIACTKSGEGLLSAKCLLVTNSSYGYHLYYCAQLIDRLFAISNIAPNYTMLLLSVASPPLLVTNLSSYYHR